MAQRSILCKCIFFEIMHVHVLTLISKKDYLEICRGEHVSMSYTASE